IRPSSRLWVTTRAEPRWTCGTEGAGIAGPLWPRRPQATGLVALSRRQAQRPRTVLRAAAGARFVVATQVVPDGTAAPASGVGTVEWKNPPPQLPCHGLLPG